MAANKLQNTAMSEKAQSSPAGSNIAVPTPELEDNGPVRICLISCAGSKSASHLSAGS